MIALGIGARSDADLTGPVLAALAAAGLAPAAVGVLASLDRRMAEERMLALARAHGWRTAGFTAAELAAQPVPNPGLAALAAVGSASVAEAAALLAAGPRADLILPKWIRDGVTVAMARSIASSSIRQ